MRTVNDVSQALADARFTGADFETILLPLHKELNSIIKQNRDQWDDVNYSLEVDCPVHLTHKATLYTYGHRYAGIWECKVEGLSDSCPHYDIETEVTEDYEGAPDKIYICSLCKVAVEGDPKADEVDDESGQE